MPSVYEVITQRIIQQLESGTAPWHKPWKARGKDGLPRNLITDREYRGINVDFAQQRICLPALAHVPPSSRTGRSRAPRRDWMSCRLLEVRNT